jgi:hypothetical protein
MSSEARYNTAEEVKGLRDTLIKIGRR